MLGRKENRMNTFCEYCTGNKRKQIKWCEDRNCPFYSFRFANISHEDEKEISKKLLGECGVIRK